jgi:hypothetical protein
MLAIGGALAARTSAMRVASATILMNDQASSCTGPEFSYAVNTKAAQEQGHPPSQ